MQAFAEEAELCLKIFSTENKNRLLDRFFIFHQKTHTTVTITRLI